MFWACYKSLKWHIFDKTTIHMRCYGKLKFYCHIFDKTTITTIHDMAMHSRDLPDPRKPKTKLALDRIDLEKLGYASFLKNYQEDRN